MDKFVRFPLRIRHRRIFYNQYFLAPYKKELLKLLDGEDYMHTLDFAKDAMRYLEIKSNNGIEGLNDSLLDIEEVINNKSNIPYSTKGRIINLHKGYNYILSHHTIDKESLRELYAILSNDLLEDYSVANMGDYYREGPVYVSRGNFDIEQQGMPSEMLDYYMDCFFDYVNGCDSGSEIDSFIESQVMHFYFVYVHPYFDVNGRTSRTVSMWHLLNNEAYPYIIFNRAISSDKTYYEKKMRHVTNSKTVDITLFLKYMLTQVRDEIERELVIHSIREKTFLSMEEAQVLEYLFLTKDFTLDNLLKKYNFHNVYMSPLDFTFKFVLPLIDRGVLVDSGDAGIISPSVPNLQLGLNGSLIDDSKKIKHLHLNKYIR